LQDVHAYVCRVRCCCICWNLVPSFNNSHAISPGKNVRTVWPLYSPHWLPALHCLRVVFMQLWLVLEDACRGPQLSLAAVVTISILTDWMVFLCAHTPCESQADSLLQTLLWLTTILLPHISQHSSAPCWSNLHRWLYMPCVTLMAQPTLFFYKERNNFLMFLWLTICEVVAFTKMCQQISHLRRIKQN
jgi:hypothetical protein